MQLQTRRKRPPLSTIDPCDEVRRHDETKLPVIRDACHEVDVLVASVTVIPQLTHIAYSQRTQSSAIAQTGRASSNAVRARPPSAGLSQPRRLCFAETRRPRERNLPQLFRSHVAQGRAGRATNHLGTYPPGFRVGEEQNAG